MRGDARGYVNARDNLDAYQRLLVDLGLRDRDPFATLRDPAGPFESAETGESWDASLAERDADAIRYVNGERYRCAEPGL
jgi:hypothetical protein